MLVLFHIFQAARKNFRKPTSDYSAFGEAGSSVAAAVVAGAWVKIEKSLKSQHELLVMNLNVA
jgi:hypothetical protein